MNEIDPLARKVGAVNTISRDGSRLKGWNTDVDGFRRAAAERAYQIAGNVVAIIGAGGAARAVAAVLQSTAGEVWVIARDLGQARRLDEDLRIERGGTVDLDHMKEAIVKADLVVNATPADLPPAGWLRTNQ